MRSTKISHVKNCMDKKLDFYEIITEIFFTILPFFLTLEGNYTTADII